MLLSGCLLQIIVSTWLLSITLQLYGDSIMYIIDFSPNPFSDAVDL